MRISGWELEEDVEFWIILLSHYVIPNITYLNGLKDTARSGGVLRSSTTMMNAFFIAFQQQLCEEVFHIVRIKRRLVKCM